MSNKSKKVGEIFSDYKTSSNIKYAEITALNVVKKDNTLQVELYFDEYIEVKEIWFFEKFLKERFKFEHIDIKINYHEGVECKGIVEEWKNIIAYMAHKYPLTKPMLLLKSDIEVKEQQILVKMHIKGADFLKAKKTDIELAKVIKNLFGKNYKIELTEEISREDIEKIKESLKKEQDQIVAKIEEENQQFKETQEIEVPEYNDSNYRPPADLEGYIPPIDGEYYENIPVENEETTIKEYIMGKPSKAKENFIKIKDITANDGRATLEGRIVTVEVRETKSGKGMIIFELYDGTGIITCKSFAKDLAEGQNIVEKIQNAHAIKIIGKAGLDTYAGDVTVIANTIIETNTDVPELPKEEEIEDTPLILGTSQNITEPLVKIQDLGVEDGKVALQGEVLYSEDRTLKSGKTLFSFDLYDGTSTITCKAFLEKDKAKKIMKRIQKSKGIKLSGTAQMDTFSNELTVMANAIIETEGIKKEIRQDNSEVKRVELHMHTQMSQMDAMTSATDLIKRAMKWGMKSIAITDHGVVQAFPEAHKLLGYDNPDMKIIYGVEAYLAPDKNAIVTNGKGQDIDTTYCVLDLETTGFSATTEKITEVGIMKVKDGEVIDEFSTFVNPEKHIPQRVSEVTNITDDMVADAETIDKVFPKILDFIEGSVLVAHNAPFDIGFLKQNAKVLGYEFDYTYIDTLSLAKDLFPDYKKYKLGKIAENLGIKVEVAHRALDDVDTTVKVFRVMMDMLKKRGAKKVEDIEEVSSTEETKKEAYKKLKTYHAIILAKNYIGLRNLYKLVSYSHLDYFYRKPRILKSLYKKYSEGLMLGSACEAGELYQAIELGRPDEEIEEIANDYDYLEIQPIGNNQFLVRNEIVKDEEALRDINRKIVALRRKVK